mmetsp:Transcript_30333/g.40515  ORF Transcript_30333/g.40515 Transcript_30333/m.40515 type:complete len:244 (-) Transcript_30333:3288-4019(-)
MSSGGRPFGRSHELGSLRKCSILRLRSTHMWSFFTSVTMAVMTSPTLTISSALSTCVSARLRRGMKPGTSPSSNLTREPKSPFRNTLPVTSFPGQRVRSVSPVKSRKSLSPAKGSIGFLGSSNGRRNSHLIITRWDNHFPSPLCSIISANVSKSNSSTLSRHLSAGTSSRGFQPAISNVGPYRPSHSAFVASNNRCTSLRESCITSRRALAFKSSASPASSPRSNDSSSNASMAILTAQLLRV